MWTIIFNFISKGGLAKEKDLLFDRIADSYVALFTNINADVKDKFLSVYPNYLSQAIYLAYITAFPESQWRFDDQFKQYLVNIIHEWTTGLKPVLGTWKQWDVAKLKTYGTDGSGEAGATTKKIMEAAALNKKNDYKKAVAVCNKLTEQSESSQSENDYGVKSRQDTVEISLDMDAFNKIVEKLGEDSELPQPEPHEVGELTSVAVTTMTPLRLPRESHQVDPGLEYERVKFNIQGHSPLIAHYLHIRRLRDFRQPGKKIRRTEITKLPHPGPTYQQFLQTKLVMSSALKTEYNRICETTNTEILELENRKREMHRNIDQLKKDLKMAKNSIERRAILERAINLKDRDSETPLLYHRSQSSLTEISANSEDN